MNLYVCFFTILQTRLVVDLPISFFLQSISQQDTTLVLQRQRRRDRLCVHLRPKLGTEDTFQQHTAVILTSPVQTHLVHDAVRVAKYEQPRTAEPQVLFLPKDGVDSIFCTNALFQHLPKRSISDFPGLGVATIRLKKRLPRQLQLPMEAQQGAFHVSR